MTDLEKKNIENEIWEILKGSESIYNNCQPVFSFDTLKKVFIMQKSLLNKLPIETKMKLQKIVKDY